jgi:hypothetical protein
MARNITEVALQMKEVVPDEYKSKFEDCISNFLFRAPELEYLSWDQLQGVMLDVIRETTENDYLIEDWQFEMVSIFSTLSIDEIKKINVKL